MDLDTQDKHHELLLIVDEFGEDLNRDEIDFVADLIDNPPEQYSTGQMSRIRGLHSRTVPADLQWQAE